MGFILGCLNWIVVLRRREIPVEESECVEKYGTDYMEYMNRAPRWLGILKTAESQQKEVAATGFEPVTKGL
jgi:hypothetical protein